MNIITQFKRQLALNGPRNTAKAAFGKIWRAVTPAKRDPWKEFDDLYGVDTCGNEVPNQTDCVGGNWEQGQRYQGCNPDNLRLWLTWLGIRYEDGETFVDLGSGKGRALLVASYFPFYAVRGVEYSAPLNLIACDNIASLGRARTWSECADASTVEFSGGPQVIFMYNPFGRELMPRVIDNIKRSMRERPRRMRVVYQGTLCADLLNERFELIQTDGWTHIYSVTP